MSKLSESSFESIQTFRVKVEDNIKKCNYLEEVAQTFTNLTYESFKESVVLARMFATIPYGQLPDFNKKFVQQLAVSKGIANLINDKTLILSLLGTSGKQTIWNNRRNSKGHIGIPLVSSAFIEMIPMMSRLLKELGMGLEWIDSKDSNIISKVIGRLSGVFYVNDAKTSVDQKGRKIISGQDFVVQNNVKTCFGFGGSYSTSDIFLIIIVFTSEMIEKKKIEHLSLTVNAIKSTTSEMVSKGKIFI